MQEEPSFASRAAVRGRYVFSGQVRTDLGDSQISGCLQTSHVVQAAGAILNACIVCTA